MEKYTDQEFFYKQTPVNYDGIAKFTSIKGNTLVWNQLVQNGNFANTNNWNGSVTSFTVSNNKATVVCGQWRGINQVVSCVPNHKYLFIATCKQSGTTTALMVMRKRKQNTSQYVDASVQITQTQSTLSVVSTTESDATTIQVLFQNNATDEKTIEISNAMLIDLTLLNASFITDYNSFKSYFPLPYYSYQSTLLPFKGTSIKTVGKNLLPKMTSSVANGITWTVNEDGTVVANGTASANADSQLSVEFTLLEGNYYFNGCPDGGNDSNTWNCYIWDMTTRTRAKQWDKTSNVLNNTNSTQSRQFYSNGTNIYAYTCRVMKGQNVSNLVFKPMVRLSSADDVYEPYTSTTTNLPTLTYFPNGMKSAGNVYDELTESKAITRVGAVDLGSFTWNYTNGVFISTTGIGKTQVAHSNPTIVCPLYTAKQVGYNTDYADEDKVIWQHPNSSLRVRDSAYTSTTAFKTAMSGVYLYYELATETETDAEDIFYKFYADGTEQLLPVNGSSPTTSYLIADIEYYDSTEGDSLYRRFWLINGDGERWDLTDKEFKSFLNNPTGLGFRKTIEVTRYGEKANKNNEVYDFPQPSGELLFYDTYNSTRYDKYNKFIRFLMSQPITLYYMIPVSYISGIANIFTLDCDVTEVQKTESKTDHILTSSIVFNGLGFYEGDEISINGTTNTYTLTNEGDFPVGFEITVEGSLTNPYITLSQDGELYGEAKFDSATAFNSLYLNSNDGEQNIILQQGGSVIPNPLSYQDLSISNGSIYVTFVKLAKGVSELSIGVESGSISNVNIKYSPKYRSV